MSLLRNKESSSGVLPVLCGKDGKWKTKLEELLRPNQVVVLLSRRRKIRAHSNIEIIEMSTRYLKKRDKGLGLKIKVKLKEK